MSILGSGLLTSVSSPQADPNPNVHVWLLKGNGTNDTNIVDNSSFNHSIVNQNGVINLLVGMIN